jgi:CubicO group peptidase (beta-lactamase class C family)
MTLNLPTPRLLHALAFSTLGACAVFTPAPVLDESVFPQIDHAIQRAIDHGSTPGAAFWLERGNEAYGHAYGKLTSDPDAAQVDVETLYDAASLTKVVVTATAIQLLIEEAKLGYEDLLIKHIPECAGAGRDALTLRHLLTHTSGLPAGLPARPAWQGKAEALKRACALVPTDAPGSLFRYSDVNFILLGFVVERASEQALNAFAAHRIFAPLGMARSGYLPLKRHDPGNIAPTQKTTSDAGESLHFDLPADHELRGIVHDPTSRFMGGVAGHAGLFTTIHDLASFARMMTNGGMINGRRFLSAESMARLTTVQSAEAAYYRRSAGWDIDTPFSRPRGSLFPVGSYGHTGFTGCILWIDPTSRTFYAFLSNRVYPNDKSSILPLYSELGSLAAKAVVGFDFANVPGALTARPSLTAPARP